MKNRLMVAAMAALVVLPISVTPANAETRGNSTNTADIELISAWLVTNGVESGVAESLIEKLDRGSLWDSVNGDTPVSFEEREINGVPSTVATYQDGSITVSGAVRPISGSTWRSQTLEVEDLAQAVSPLQESPLATVSECMGMGTPDWAMAEDCYIFFSSAIVTMSFRADYRLETGLNDWDSVSNPRDEARLLIGASVVGEELEIIRGTEASASHPAEIRYRVSGEINVGPVPISIDTFLKLRVGQDYARAEI